MQGVEGLIYASQGHEKVAYLTTRPDSRILLVKGSSDISESLRSDKLGCFYELAIEVAPGKDILIGDPSSLLLL